MKKVFSLIFVAAFLLLSVTLSLGILVAGPSEAGANEVLSKDPAIFDKEGNFNTNILSDVSAWINDHFFLRQELISVNNAMTATLFQTSGEDSVILGKNGWLYYGSTLDDYTGLNGMTEQELYAAAKNIALMAEYCENQDRDFRFMIAPNKNSLYPQFMPDYGVKADIHDAHRLHGLLSDMDVPYIDLFAVIGDASVTAVSPLYFAHDSHWNDMGAALAADTINAQFGVESSYYESSNFKYPYNHSGDLFEMVYPAFQDGEDSWLWCGPLEFEYTSKATRPDSITLTTASEKDGSLLVYRDSFGNLLYPFLADSYGTVRFSRSTSYDLTYESDFVLIELVERNLDYLITYIPVMESPVREIAAVEETVGTAEATLQEKAKAPEGLKQWKGTLPATPDAGSAIYVSCGGTVYEAFCLKDNGFAVYLPEGKQPSAVAAMYDSQMLAYELVS